MFGFSGQTAGWSSLGKGNALFLLLVRFRAKTLIYKNIYSGISTGFRISRKLLRNLVGLPRFELGTSCTPIKQCVDLECPKKNSSQIRLLKREALCSYKIDYSGFSDVEKMAINY